MSLKPKAVVGPVRTKLNRSQIAAGSSRGPSETASQAVDRDGGDGANARRAAALASLERNRQALELLSKA